MKVEGNISSICVLAFTFGLLLISHTKDIRKTYVSESKDMEIQYSTSSIIQTILKIGLKLLAYFKRDADIMKYILFNGKCRCNLKLSLMKVYYIGGAIVWIDTITLHRDDVAEIGRLDQMQIEL